MDSTKLTGQAIPGDQRVPVTVRDWDAMKRAIWRSKTALAIAEHGAREIIDRCVHEPDCPGASDDAEPCTKLCRDREQRMSALVILGAAQHLAPVDARRPADGLYFAPSREYFSDVLAELGAAQATLAALYARGVAPPTPDDLAPLLAPPEVK